MKNSIFDYSGLQNAPRWSPKTHPRMAGLSRAMQFHPFDFSGQLELDEEVALTALLKNAGFDVGMQFDEDNEPF